MKREYPTLKGFNRAGIYRMKQFYKIYKDNEIVAPMVRQISWTNNVLILGATKTIEEKEFYIRMCIKNNYTKRELDRQEKKKNENPSVGVILCSNKDEKVVEYAMSRSMSPTMVLEYTLKLIDKKILERKLKEISSMVQENSSDN